MSTWTGVDIIFSIFFLIIDQDSPITPKEDATKYKHASSSNPTPLTPAGVHLTPSTSLAPGFSLTSKPSSSNSEQDEILMRAIGENISESASASDSTSESYSGTASKPQQQPNVLETVKDDPNNPR